MNGILGRSVAPEPKPIDPRDFEHVGELPRRMLQDFVADPVGWSVDRYAKEDIAQVMAGLGTLSIEGLIDTGRAGRFVTSLGKQLAAMWTAEAYAAEPQDGTE